MRERMSTAEFLEWSVFLAREAQRKELAMKKAGHG